MSNVRALVATAERCADSFRNVHADETDDQLEGSERASVMSNNVHFHLFISDRLRVAADCAKAYWTQKVKMAPGSDPPYVNALIDLLYEKNIIMAGWLAGAGRYLFQLLLLINQFPTFEFSWRRIFIHHLE